MSALVIVKLLFAIVCVLSMPLSMVQYVHIDIHVHVSFIAAAFVTTLHCIYIVVTSTYLQLIDHCGIVFSLITDVGCCIIILWSLFLF